MCARHMNMHRRSGAPSVVAATLAPLVLAGCASGMNPGAPMMGDRTAMHYAAVSCAAPSPLPGTVIQVRLADVGMTQMVGGPAPMDAHMVLTSSPASVTAGVVTFVVSNQGWRAHELVVLPLTGDSGHRTPGPDGKVSESGSVGESSRSCAADTGDGLASGSVGWTTVTLAAGRYELVCNLPNHYADGMHQELTVA